MNLQELQALLELYGLKVEKTRNCTRNLGKTPILVLLDALHDVGGLKNGLVEERKTDRA